MTRHKENDKYKASANWLKHSNNESLLPSPTVTKLVVVGSENCYVESVCLLVMYFCLFVSYKNIELYFISDKAASHHLDDTKNISLFAQS